MFSFYITNYFDALETTGSRLLLGGYDLEKYAKPGSSVMWAPLVHEYYWMVRLTSAKLTNSKIFPFAMQNCSTQIVIDSGTSYMVMPAADFESIQYFFTNGLRLTLVEHKGFWRTECSFQQFQDMPNIEVGLNGHILTIPRESYILR